MAEKDHDTLQNYYYRIKAEELIFLFFKALFNRPPGRHYPVNVHDLKTIYATRDQLIQNFAARASLKKLAASAHMSESKLNRLFKQVFGHTLGSYHQRLRINRAAELIRHQHYS